MKTTVTKSELKECIKNALQRVIDEGFDKEQIAAKHDRDKNFKKKSPKHGKMGPVKNDKYKNWKDEY